MYRKIALWAIILTVMFSSLGIFVHLITKTYTKSLSQTFVQQKINEKLPKLVAYDRFRVTSAQVLFAEKSAKVLIDIEGAKTASITAQISVIGAPRYNKFKGEFFFDPEDVVIEKINGPWSNSNQLTNRFEGWIKDHAETVAISTLENFPVFRLKDEMKWSWVIRSSLKNVEVKSNELVISFSVLAMTIQAFFVFLMLVASLGFAFAAIMNPSLMVGMIFFSSIN